jgi:hypothetical protein
MVVAPQRKKLHRFKIREEGYETKKNSERIFYRLVEKTNHVRERHISWGLKGGIPILGHYQRSPKVTIHKNYCLS